MVSLPRHGSTYAKGAVRHVRLEGPFAHEVVHVELWLRVGLRRGDTTLGRAGLWLAPFHGRLRLRLWHGLALSQGGNTEENTGDQHDQDQT